MSIPTGERDLTLESNSEATVLSEPKQPTRECLASPAVAALTAIAVAAAVSTVMWSGLRGNEHSDSPMSGTTSSIRDTFVHETLKPNTKYLQMPSQSSTNSPPLPSPHPDNNPHIAGK